MRKRLPPTLKLWRDESLRSYHHRCPDAGGVIKLARFPIRHPDTPVGGGLARQVTLVQSVAGREFEKVGHRGANEMRMRWPAVTPAIDVGLHDFVPGINVVAIETGAMIFVFTEDLKATDRSAVSFPTTRYPGRRDSVLPAVEIGFLRPQVDGDRRP